MRQCGETSIHAGACAITKEDDEGEEEVGWEEKHDQTHQDLGFGHLLLSRKAEHHHSVVHPLLSFLPLYPRQEP